VTILEFGSLCTTENSQVTLREEIEERMKRGIGRGEREEGEDYWIQVKFPSLISKILTPPCVPAANRVPFALTDSEETHPPNESVVAFENVFI
jgi:hypothetical protein